MRIELCLDQRFLRRWHVVLLDRLAAQPEIEVGIRWAEPSDESLPSCVGTLFELERIVHRVYPTLSTSVSANDLGRHVGQGGTAPDIVLDLSGGLPVAGQRRWRLLFDGGRGESAIVGALLAGRTPVVTISDAVTGAEIASGRPGVEQPGVIVAAFEDVLARTVGLVAAAFSAFPPRLVHRSETPTLRCGRVVAFGAKAMARAALMRLYRLLYRTPHWRTGWRFVSGPDVVDLGTHPEGGWRDLPDDGLRFYADPFPIVVNGTPWLFLEDLEHRTGKGVISAVPFDERGPVGTPRVVMEQPFHLSYPVVFEDAGTIWMIPESTATGTVDLYRATRFPGGWVHEATLLAGIEASDATPFRHGGRWWMTATVKDGGSYSDALHLWSAPSLRGPWEAHPGNPVLIDSATARPAGHVVRRGGRLIRPVQDCRGGYGSAVALAEITRLDETHFEQVVRARIAPGQAWAGRRLHTLNRADHLEVIDGSAMASRLVPRSWTAKAGAADDRTFARDMAIAEPR